MVGVGKLEVESFFLSDFHADQALFEAVDEAFATEFELMTLAGAIFKRRVVHKAFEINNGRVAVLGGTVFKHIFEARARGSDIFKDLFDFFLVWSEDFLFNFEAFVFFQADFGANVERGREAKIFLLRGIFEFELGGAEGLEFVFRQSFDVVTLDQVLRDILGHPITVEGFDRGQRGLSLAEALDRDLFLDVLKDLLKSAIDNGLGNLDIEFALQGRGAFKARFHKFLRVDEEQMRSAKMTADPRGDPPERQEVIAPRNALLSLSRQTEKLMSQQIHFVSGKGGVGKSVVAAALALKLSREGRRTLLVELGTRSFYKTFFSMEEPGFSGRENKGLWIAQWTGEDCLKEYARHLIKVPALADLFLENQVSRSLINVAPALPELAILGKATSGPRRHGPKLAFEAIVIDAPATGHFLSLLRAPKGMSEAIRFGPMGEQSRGIDAVLRDPQICQTHLVSLPEELPVQETEELVAALKQGWSYQPRIYLNKWMDLDQVSEASLQGPHPFARFVRVTRDRQLSLKKRLEGLSLEMRLLPLVIEEDPWVVVETLAGGL